MALAEEGKVSSVGLPYILAYRMGKKNSHTVLCNVLYQGGILYEEISCDSFRGFDHDHEH